MFKRIVHGVKTVELMYEYLNTRNPLLPSQIAQHSMTFFKSDANETKNFIENTDTKDVLNYTIRTISALINQYIKSKKIDVVQAQDLVTRCVDFNDYVLIEKGVKEDIDLVIEELSKCCFANKLDIGEVHILEMSGIKKLVLGFKTEYERFVSVSKPEAMA